MEMGGRENSEVMMKSRTDNDDICLNGFPITPQMWLTSGQVNSRRAQSLALANQMPVARYIWQEGLTKM